MTQRSSATVTGGSGEASSGRNGVRRYAIGYSPRTTLKAFNGPAQSTKRGIIVAWAMRAMMAWERSIAPIVWLP